MNESAPTGTASDPNPKYLCFVETIGDCRKVEAYRRWLRIAAQDVLPVALSFESSQWFAQRHRSSAFVWDLMDSQAAQFVAQERADAAYQRFVVHAPRALRLYRIAAWSPYRFFLYHAFLSRSIVRFVTGRYPSAHLLLLPNEQQPMSLLTASSDSSNSVFRAVTIAHAKRRRISHTVLPGSRRCGWLGGLKPWARMISQFVRELAGSGRSVVLPLQQATGGSRRSNPAPEVLRSAKGCDAILSNWGYDFDLTLGLDDVVTSDCFAGFRLLHLVWSPEHCRIPPSFSKGHRACRVRAGIQRRLDYALNFVLAVVGSEAWRFLRSRWARSAWKCFPLCDPNLRFQHIHLLLTAYADAYFGRQVARHLISQVRPRLWVSSDSDAPRVRSMLLAARSLGVKTASLCHGYNLMALPREKFVADYHVAWTEAMAQSAIEAGVRSDYVKVADATVGGRSPGVLPRLRGVKGQVRIAVVTSSWYGLWSSPYEARRYRATIETLCAAAAERPGWHLTLKSHPVSDYYAYFDQLVRNFGAANVEHIRERWALEQFAQCTVAVFPGEVSGSILDCQQAGVPVVFVADCVSQWQQRRRRPDIEGCGVIARDVHEAIQSIERLVADPDYRSHVSTIGRFFCTRYLPDPHAAVQGLAANLAEILSIPGVALQSEAGSECVPGAVATAQAA